MAHRPAARRAAAARIEPELKRGVVRTGGEGQWENGEDIGSLFLHGKNISRTGYVGICREMFYQYHIVASQIEPIVTCEAYLCRAGTGNWDELDNRKRDNEC